VAWRHGWSLQLLLGRSRAVNRRPCLQLLHGCITLLARHLKSSREWKWPWEENLDPKELTKWIFKYKPPPHFWLNVHVVCSMGGEGGIFRETMVCELSCTTRTVFLCLSRRNAVTSKWKRGKSDEVVSQKWLCHTSAVAKCSWLLYPYTAFLDCWMSITASWFHHEAFVSVLPDWEKQQHPIHSLGGLAKAYPSSLFLLILKCYLIAWILMTFGNNCIHNRPT